MAWFLRDKELSAQTLLWRLRMKLLQEQRRKETRMAMPAYRGKSDIQRSYPTCKLQTIRR